MTRAAPRVTIAIPTYRRPELLRQTLASALEQTVEEIEVFVSDNGNDPETAEVVASFADPRVAYAPLDENVGFHRNMTRCLGLGTASYVRVLQDDDLLLPRSTEVLLARLEQDERIGVVHTGHSVIDGSGRLLRSDVNWSNAKADWHLAGPEFIRASLTSGVFFHISTALLRRSLVVDEEFEEDAGGYDDLGVWLRLASRGAHFAYVHEPLCAIREHASSESALQGLHAVRDGGDEEGAIDTQTFEQVRQMQFVRKRFLDREGSVLPDRERIWSLARRDARKRLARIIVKEALAHGSVRRTGRRLQEAGRIDPRIRTSVWALGALGVAAGGRPARRVVNFLGRRLTILR